MSYLTSMAGEQRYERDFKQMEKPYQSNEGAGVNTQLLFSGETKQLSEMFLKMVLPKTHTSFRP